MHASPQRRWMWAGRSLLAPGHNALGGCKIKPSAGKNAHVAPVGVASAFACAERSQTAPTGNGHACVEISIGTRFFIKGAFDRGWRHALGAEFAVVLARVFFNTWS